MTWPISHLPHQTLSSWVQVLQTQFSLTYDSSLISRIVRLVGVIREWANKNFREEEPRPDSFLERFRGPELQTVTTQQGDGKGDKDGEGKGTKYTCPICGTGRAPKHAIGGLGGVSYVTMSRLGSTLRGRGDLLQF